MPHNFAIEDAAKMSDEVFQGVVTLLPQLSTSAAQPTYQEVACFRASMKVNRDPARRHPLSAWLALNFDYSSQARGLPCIARKRIRRRIHELESRREGEPSPALGALDLLRRILGATLLWSCPRPADTSDVGVSPRGGCSNGEERGERTSASTRTAIVHAHVQGRGRGLGATGGSVAAGD